MKVILSRQLYDQLPFGDKQSLVPVPCRCGGAPECDSCSGLGLVYEFQLSAEDSAAIQENLRRQGVPLGKIGTN